MDEKDRDQTSLPVADLERTAGNGPVEKKKGSGLDSCRNRKVRIAVHSKRNRLCDADGISAKAAIDGLVHRQLLENDSPEFVESVSYSQEKVSGNEETVITIEWD